MTREHGAISGTTEVEPPVPAVRIGGCERMRALRRTVVQQDPLAELRTRDASGAGGNHDVVAPVG